MAKPTAVEAYIASLPQDRRAAISSVRAVILKSLPKGYEEGIQYGMIGYFVPHSIFPKGYHANPKEPLPFVSLGSKKSHMALHLLCIYGDSKSQEWLAGAYKKAGKKLELGKACLRFKRLDDVALDVVGQLIGKFPVATYVKRYEATIGAKATKPSPRAEKKVTTTRGAKTAKKSGARSGGGRGAKK